MNQKNMVLRKFKITNNIAIKVHKIISRIAVKLDNGLGQTESCRTSISLLINHKQCDGGLGRMLKAMGVEPVMFCNFWGVLYHMDMDHRSICFSVSKQSLPR